MIPRSKVLLYVSCLGIVSAEVRSCCRRHGSIAALRAIAHAGTGLRIAATTEMGTWRGRPPPARAQRRSQ